jgi:hypothetical protein
MVSRWNRLEKDRRPHWNWSRANKLEKGTQSISEYEASIKTDAAAKWLAQHENDQWSLAQRDKPQDNTTWVRPQRDLTDPTLQTELRRQMRMESELKCEMRKRRVEQGLTRKQVRKQMRKEIKHLRRRKQRNINHG